MAQSQPIEMSGETIPLNYQDLVKMLSFAASSNIQEMKIGSAQLINWQKQSTFYSLVQDVFCDLSLPQDVRHLAITQLKNAATQFWRKTAPNAIPKEQKDKIKVTAVQVGVLEPVSVLAVQNALFVAKIVRQEYPQDWPDAISSMITVLHAATEPGANPHQLPGVLKIILEVTKALSEGRILRIQEGFRSVAPEILRVLGTIYIDKVNQWVATLEQGILNEEFMLTIEQSLLCLRTLRRLIIGGFARPGYNQDVQEFWAVTCSHLVKFVSLAKEAAKSAENNMLIEKHILQLTKLHANMSTTHPASFATFSQTIDLLKTYWTMLLELGEDYVSLGQNNDEEGSTWQENAGLRTLNLIRSCVNLGFKPFTTFKTPTQQDKDDRKVAVERIKSELFTDDFVVGTMEVLVTKFFRFRDCDSEKWEYQAEEWEMGEENNAAYEYSIHFCSQKLFQDLVIYFPSLLVPRLMDTFQNFASLENQDVIFKDMVYCALGLAAPTLLEHMHFNSLMESVLIPEVQIEKPEYSLLRRRIAIVLSSWVPLMKPGDLNTSGVYQIFQHLLNKDDPFNHQVVRLTAGRHLCHVIDPYDFAPDQLSPFAASIIGNLMMLIQETELSETQLAMLDTLRVVVLKMEHNIAPYSDQIISFLPTLWDKSEDEILLRQGILSLMAALIHSLKDNSARYHTLLLPLVKASLDPNSATFEDFLYDTLELWAALVMQSPSPASPDLLAVLPDVIPIIERGADCTPMAIQVVESYVLLAPKEIVGDDIRLPLLHALGQTLTIKEVNPGAVTRIVQKMIRGAETIDGGSEATYGIISKSLIDSGFLRLILQGLYSAHQASQSTGPNGKKSQISGVVEGHYFSVLARLALANPSIFAAAIATATGSTEEQTLDWVLSEWFFYFDSVPNVTERKLQALGLTQLFSLRGPNGPPNFILNRLQYYLTMWTGIIVELGEGCGDHPQADFLVHWDSTDPETAAAQNVEATVTPQNARETEWSNSDPVYCLGMRDFVRERLTQAIIACGGVQRFQEEWLVNVDSDVSAAFGALGLI